MKEDKYQPKYAPVSSITIESAGKSKRVLARIMVSLTEGDFTYMLRKVENLPQTIKVNTTSAFIYDNCIDNMIEFDIEYKCH